MLTKKELVFLFEELKKRYPENKTELVYDTPYQLVMAVILSAQTTDKQVNKTTSLFFDKIKTPHDLLKWGYDNFERGIKSIGLYKTKAKNIRNMSKIISEKNFIDTTTPLCQSILCKVKNKNKVYIIPDKIELLTQLPGIGEKTARVVAHVLYGLDTIAVDTHVHRVTNRLGLVETKTPEQTTKIIDDIVPKKYRGVAHHSLIYFGRYFCKAKKPMCPECPFKKFCKFYEAILKS